tara:strand:+ start:472 stop:942 length:471 start_codon:yes stop_codon:yes gene_type:complete
MSIASARLREALLRFKESSALQRDPRETFALRLVLLRLLLCTGDPDPQQTVAALDNDGIPMLKFDVDLTLLHHRQGVLGMAREDWLELFSLLDHSEATQLVDALQAKHDDSMAGSPLARVRGTLESALGLLPSGSVLCQVFLSLLATALYHIFKFP